MNTLWPRTTIKTAAVQNLLGGDALSSVSRTPEIMGDAAYAILTSPSKGCTGNFFVDDEVMATIGVQYVVGRVVACSCPGYVCSVLIAVGVCACAPSQGLEQVQRDAGHEADRLAV